VPRLPSLRWLAPLAMALSAALPATGRAQAEDDPVVIDHANELRRVVEGDSLTYFLEGAVRAHRGPIQMRSELATIFRHSQVADFQRNVHFWDATTEIYADRLLYYEVSNQALATGSVQVIDRRSGSQVAADTVLYERDRGLITARPRPHGIVLPQDTTSQEDPFHVYADLMVFHSDSLGTEMDGIGRVLIERTDLTAVGDSLHYDEQASRVALRKEPRVETSDTYLTAERIDVLLEENRIDALVARDGARAVDKTDSIPAAVPAAFNHVSEYSFLEGDSLNIEFAEGEIDWLVAQGRARSLNYALESPSGPIETWSINYLLGERLELNFRGDTLNRVVASGGHRGVYRSEEIRRGGPERRPSESIPLPPELALLAGAAPPGAGRRGQRRGVRGAR
jgi:lipopolysaccharide export system protein LptA